MGLMDLTEEKLAKIKELLELLSFFGITEDDLKYLPEALKLVKENSMPKKFTMTDKEKSELEDKKKKTLTPEEFIEHFRTEDLEGL